MNYLNAEQLIKQYQHLIGKSIAPQIKGWSLPIRFMIIAPRDQWNKVFEVMDSPVDNQFALLKLGLFNHTDLTIILLSDVKTGFGIFTTLEKYLNELQA